MYKRPKYRTKCITECVALLDNAGCTRTDDYRSIIELNHKEKFYNSELTLTRTLKPMPVPAPFHRDSRALVRGDRVQIDRCLKLFGPGILKTRRRTLHRRDVVFKKVDLGDFVLQIRGNIDPASPLDLEELPDRW